MSYLGVRRSLGMLAFLLPLVLGPFGFFVLGIEVQENMSSYYHTPLRDIFVGAMCAMGIFLFCYHGYDSLENWTGHFGLRLKTRDEQRDGLYLATGLTIVGCMTLMGIHLFLLPDSSKAVLNKFNFIFWMEWITIWAFSAAWLVKGQALLAGSFDSNELEITESI